MLPRTTITIISFINKNVKDMVKIMVLINLKNFLVILSNSINKCTAITEYAVNKQKTLLNNVEIKTVFVFAIYISITVAKHFYIAFISLELTSNIAERYMNERCNA